MKLYIKGELTDLNTFVNAERTNRYIGAKIKKTETERIYWSCREQQLQVKTKPCTIIFSWYSKNKKKDNDNISFAKKFILDGLVQAGILYDDTQEWVTGFEDHFYIDKDNPHIVVELK